MSCSLSSRTSPARRTWPSGAEGELLEVYVGAFDRDGVPLVFEAYLTTEAMDENAQTIVSPFATLIVGSLLLFLLIVLPFALSLSRRVESAQAERATLMHNALLASELERRRIAEELHEGVVQDMAGLRVHPSCHRSSPREGRSPDRGASAALARRRPGRADPHGPAVADDRHLPPDLHGPGSGHAVRQLVQTESATRRIGERGGHRRRPRHPLRGRDARLPDHPRSVRNVVDTPTPAGSCRADDRHST